MNVSEDRALVLFEPKPNNIYNFDALQLLRLMPSESVNCIVTSPPYFGLRSYTDGDEREIGKEQTPAEYITALVRLFREARRVLRRDGVMWLNLGDSYAGSGKGPTGHNGIGTQERRQGFHSQPVRIPDGMKPKDRMMIPARVAIALQEDGWYLRDEIVWHKLNCMPASVTDRTTSAHEMVYLLSKSPRYWYDAEAIKEDAVNGDAAQPRGSVASMSGGDASLNGGRRKQDDLGKRTYTGFNERYFSQPPLTKRNKRSVWTINTQPLAAAHFAVMPEALVEPCLLAGCPAKVCAECGAPWERVVERTGETPRQKLKERGAAEYFKANGNGLNYAGGHGSNTRAVNTLGWQPTCDCHADTRPGLAYDPFMGAGTVALVAQRHGRDYLGSELNPEYVTLARMRVAGRLDEYLAKQRGEPVTAYMFEGGAA